MTIDWAVVFATIAGPILAVWASEWRQAKKAIHDRKEWVFRTLWSTRSAKLQPEHVQALNHIDFAFQERDYPEIADAWHLYNQHLNSDQGNTKDSFDRWHEKAHTLLVGLILLMAKDLKVSFSKSLANQHSYHPIAYVENEKLRNEINVALLDILKGNEAIKVEPREKSP